LEKSLENFSQKKGFTVHRFFSPFFFQRRVLRALPIMAPSKRVQREKSVSATFQEAIVAHVESARLERTKDAELFVVDTASVSIRRRKKILLALVKEAPKVRERPALEVAVKQRKRPVDAAIEIIDLWGQSSGQSSKKSRLTPIQAKPSACHPGLSYNPQTSDHQDILALAVSVELRRDEAKSEVGPLEKISLECPSSAPAELGDSDEVLAECVCFTSCMHHVNWKHAAGIR
jgi:hypothetical protein